VGKMSLKQDVFNEDAAVIEQVIPFFLYKRNFKEAYKPSKKEMNKSSAGNMINGTTLVNCKLKSLTSIS
jgi:hypothetical protein